ncbi:Hypothetical predicted protein [Paramuricea clavata]|uniref:Selenoprotein F n=1 Tax=Paramuricea clavata TaxID=317549 RepID=A0A7D9E4W2_PARCT|nr:Hypothetical predicted protein [Paramuricea clavata]
MAVVKLIRTKQQLRSMPKLFSKCATEKLGAFVRGGKRSQFPNLDVKYLRGMDPVLKLYDSNGEMKEELSIDKWNTDSVEEFLKEKLQ